MNKTTKTTESAPIAAHTPGPWSVAHGPIYGAPFVTNSNGKLSITGSIGPKPTGESEANARLIAAAPELLAALKDLAKLADFTRPAERAAWLAAQAAIDRAEKRA